MKIAGNYILLQCMDFSKHSLRDRVGGTPIAWGEKDFTPFALLMFLLWINYRLLETIVSAVINIDWGKTVEEITFFALIFERLKRALWALVAQWSFYSTIIPASALTTNKCGNLLMKNKCTADQTKRARKKLQQKWKNSKTFTIFSQNFHWIATWICPLKVCKMLVPCNLITTDKFATGGDFTCLRNG